MFFYIKTIHYIYIMSHTSFGNFLDKKYEVKFISNKHLEYNFEYIDYRVGCDLCGNGDACGLKTNFPKLMNKEKFLLNELEIDFEDAWYNDNELLTLETMYETSNKKIIHLLYKYYLKFNATQFGTNIFNKINISSKETKNGGKLILTSIFESEEKLAFTPISLSELDRIKKVHICGKCYEWFISIHNNKYRKYFAYQNPLKYFWVYFVEVYLNDLIEFESETIMNSFYNTYKDKETK